MPKFNDLTNKSFTRLTVIERAPNKGTSTMWLCRCICGTVKPVAASALITGLTASCGCLMRSAHITHGLSSTRVYRAWSDMKWRCLKSTHPSFKDYGGRGIQICKEWLDFTKFRSDMGDPPPGYLLDRINVEGGYCKDNCRWASPKESSRTRRTNVVVFYKGKSQCIFDWCAELGIKYDSIKYRVRKYKETHLEALIYYQRKKQHVSTDKERNQSKESYGENLWEEGRGKSLLCQHKC